MFQQNTSYENALTCTIPIILENLKIFAHPSFICNNSKIENLTMTSHGSNDGN